MFALARAVDDAAHHRHLHVLDARVALFQAGISRAEVVDLLASSWKVVLVVAAAARAGRDAGVEGCAGPGPAGISSATTTSCVRASPGCGVSDTRMVSPMPSCSSMRQRRRRRHRALGAHAGLGEAQVQQVVAARASAGRPLIRSCTPDLATDDDLLRVAGPISSRAAPPTPAPTDDAPGT